MRSVEGSKRPPQLHLVTHFGLNTFVNVGLRRTCETSGELSSGLSAVPGEILQHSRLFQALMNSSVLQDYNIAAPLK